jgi:hypothetical protein
MFFFAFSKNVILDDEKTGIEEVKLCCGIVFLTAASFATHKDQYHPHPPVAGTSARTLGARGNYSATFEDEYDDEDEEYSSSVDEEYYDEEYGEEDYEEAVSFEGGSSSSVSVEDTVDVELRVNKAEDPLVESGEEVETVDSDFVQVGHYYYLLRFNLLTSSFN